MTRTRPLDFFEIRVLGTLMEKEQTTPDQYPLTINALIAGCNQKTNRDPLTQLTETEVVEAVDRLRLDVLTWRHEGARVERWEQRLDRRWGLDKARKALMTLLLLRGPQTPGELKTRAERMHHFEDKEAVELVLRGLSEGLDALVEELPRQPGHRENRWMHLAATDEAKEMIIPAVAAVPVVAVTASSPAARDSAPRGPSSMVRIETLERTVEELTETASQLEGSVDHLERELHQLRVRLGDLNE